MDEKVVNCPVCSSARYSAYCSIHGYEYLRCLSCQSLFVSDAPSVHGVAAHSDYSNDYFKDDLTNNFSGYMDYAGQSHALRKNFRRYLDLLEPHIGSEAPKVLDVGCAYGFLLDEIRRRWGGEVQGVDCSQWAIQWMGEHLDIPGTVGIVNDVPDGSFDLVTLSEVVEHIRDPHALLAEINGRLHDQGLLLVVTGAADSYIAKALGKKWWYLNPPDHCIIYSRSGLDQLVRTHGFEVINHRLFPYHWVGLNNGLLKIARILNNSTIAELARRMPSMSVPVPHYTTQLLIAGKGG